MLRKELHQANRLSWNEATVAHNSHKRDQAHYLRHEGHTLFPEELDLLGELAGKSLVHLQCNAGQDSLSLAKLGASVTGVDISDTAIEFARQLSSDTGIRATFHRADIYDWLELAGSSDERFEIAFSSYGALVWLSDLTQWARGVSEILRPGGRLVLVEFHPFSMVFEEDWSLKYPYFAGGEPMSFDPGIGDYVAMSGASLAPSGYMEGVRDFQNPHPCFEFQWTLGDIISAVLGADLCLKTLREYPYANGAKLMDKMIERPGGRMYPPSSLPTLPLMFGLVAQKKE